MLASIAVYLFLALSYVQVTVNNDGLVYYDFMRRLIGENAPGYAYQFGSSFWNLPFYLVGRLVSSLGVGDTVSGLSVGNIAVAIAANVAVAVIFYLSWRLVRGVGLPGGPGATLLTVLGTPLFYYAVFQPAYKHAVDALLISLFALLLLEADRKPGSTKLAAALGAVLAVAISVRYANTVLIIGPLVLLVRARALVQTYVLTTVAIVGATAILLIPLARGIPYGLPSSTNPSPGRTQGGAQQPVPAPTVAEGGDITNGIQFAPLAPVRMLFTTKRGLFVWTPLCLLATAGYLWHAFRTREHRRFLLSLGLSALALLVVHSLWGTYWTGGYSFSQRFLTGLFPVFVIGIAALLRATRMLATPLLVGCIAWSMFLALYHYYGYDHVSERDGARRIVRLYTSHEESLGELWRVRIEMRVRHRWHAYGDWLTR